MASIVSLYTYITSNSAALIAALFGLYAFLEVIVRLTPTKTDDTILEKFGKVLKAVFNAVGVPNRQVLQVEIKEKIEETK